ncbi:MAG: ABC transporter permease, partial [Spirochaetaceae bacterium]
PGGTARGDKEKVSETKRPTTTLLSITVAVTAAFVLVICAVILFSDDPFHTLVSFFTAPFKGRYYFGNFLNTAGILTIAGTGMALAFRGGVFNLGGEGQVYSSALAATLFLLWAGPVGIGGVPAIALSLLLAAFTGAFIASVSGFLKMKWNTDELISSFLLSSSLVYVIDYLITGPLRDTSSYLLSSPEIAEEFRLTPLLPPSHLNISFIAALLIAIASFRFLFHSSSGYELRMCGLNREFARYGGIPVKRYDLIPMGLSGALYGLAGGFYVTGTQYAAIQGFTTGIGWNGIAVALVARTHPLFTLPAAMLFSFIEVGARNATVVADFSSELGSIVRATVLFLITLRISAGRWKK